MPYGKIDKEFYDDEKYLSKAEKSRLAVQRYQHKVELVYPEWERQDSETLQSWEAFKIYRDMGATRSLSRVAKELVGPGDKYKSKYKVIFTWSAKWSWVDRIVAYQKYIDELYQDEVKNQVKEMASRHADFAKNTMQSLYVPVIKFIQEFQEIEKLKNKPNKSELEKKKLKESGFESMTLNQLLSLVYKSGTLLPQIADMERKSRGEPTNITSNDVTSGGNQIIPDIKIVVHGSQSTILKEYESKL